MAALQFSKMFQAFSDANEKEWKYDRNASLGASEAFACLRKAFFKKFGYEADDEYVADWGAAKRGDLIESHFAVPAVQAILPKGATLLYAGGEQETLRDGRLSATPDGLAIGLDRDALAELGIDDILTGELLVEFKSFDPRANPTEPKPVHSGQVQVQFGLVHQLTEYRPEYAIIVYMNASFLSDIRVFVIKRDPKIFDAAVQRAKLLFRNEDPKDLPAEGKLSGDCKMCEFTEECAIAQGEATPKKKNKIENPEVIERLELLSKRQKEFATVEKDATQDKKVVEEEIKEILRTNDTKGAGTPGAWTISLSWCKGKKSLDQLALAADGVDLEKYQKEGNGYDRLTVRVAGASDDGDDD
jgi:hypothetical protein